MGKVNIELDEETHKQAKVYSAILNMNLKDYISKSIELNNLKNRELINKC